MVVRFISKQRINDMDENIKIKARKAIISFLRKPHKDRSHTAGEIWQKVFSRGVNFDEMKTLLGEMAESNEIRKTEKYFKGSFSTQSSESYTCTDDWWGK